MAPSSGHYLVPKAIKAFRFAVSKTASFVRSRLPQTSEASARLETVPIRTTRQPIHPIAALRQSRSQTRNFSTSLRRLLLSSEVEATKATPARRSFPVSAIGNALKKTAQTPFTSTLRPNLTGGAIPRSAGGYSLGGQGVRHFSHTGASNANVISNVSAAIRAFAYQGYQVRFDGVDSTGQKRFKAITVAQDKAASALRRFDDKATVKGTSLNFRIAPTVTALSPLEDSNTLESDGLITGLASDFSRSLTSLATIQAELKRLTSLGPLPISLIDGSTISVRFPGCDATIVSALCDELGICRGVIREDEGWDDENGDRDVEMALLFPWAPSKPLSYAPSEAGDEYFEEQALFDVGDRTPGQSLEWQSMLSHRSLASPIAKSHSATRSLGSYSFADNPWANDGSSYDGLNHSDFDSNESLGFDLDRTQTARPLMTGDTGSATEYEGVEGIYRFIAECDAAGRR